jgi:hypothetical protein
MRGISVQEKSVKEQRRKPVNEKKRKDKDHFLFLSL